MSFTKHKSKQCRIIYNLSCYSLIHSVQYPFYILVNDKYVHNYLLCSYYTIDLSVSNTNNDIILLYSYIAICHILFITYYINMEFLRFIFYIGHF